MIYTHINTIDFGLNLTDTTEDGGDMISDHRPLRPNWRVLPGCVRRC